MKFKKQYTARTRHSHDAITLRTNTKPPRAQSRYFHCMYTGIWNFFNPDSFLQLNYFSPYLPCIDYFLSGIFLFKKMINYVNPKLTRIFLYVFIICFLVVAKTWPWSNLFWSKKNIFII
jgi:hypothetical protein